jgi:hypothetical protein
MSLITNVKFLAQINFDPNAQVRFSNGENIRLLATINGIEKCVPIDPANSDYSEIMRQVEAGTLTIQPADEPEQPEEPNA